MMHRLTAIWCYASLNDVTHFIRNDAMFAIKCGEATHHSRSEHHWACPTSFAVGKHHSKRPHLSGRQLWSFCWWRRGELNPCPKTHPHDLLRVQTVYWNSLAHTPTVRLMRSVSPEFMTDYEELIDSRSPLIDALAEPRCSQVGRPPN